MKKLYRSTDYRKIAGVCGGLGEYFNIDPIIFRMIFIALFFNGGAGIIIYILMWIFVPIKTAEKSSS
jgi:phage shock protein C